MVADNTAASAAGVTAWAFDMYTPASVVEPNDPDPKHEALMAGLDGYLASSNKSSMKFWMTVIVDDRYGLSYPATNHWKYLIGTPSFSSYVCNLFNDAQYLRIDGKPVIGLFSSGGSGPALTLTQWDSFLSCVTDHTGAFVVQMSCSSTDATTFHTNAQFCYGIQNTTGGQGHKLWSVLETADKNQWASSLSGGFVRITQLSNNVDPRALDSAPGSTTWMDQPTQPQWFQHIIDGLSIGNSRMAITFWDELSEEGHGISPTVGESTRYLDAVKWARVGPVPSTYSYEVSLHSLLVTTIGTGWTYVDPWSGNAIGAHEGDEDTSATTNDSKELSHPSMTGCGLYARTGPDQGIVETFVDGVSQGTTDLYSASTIHHVNVWNSGALSDQTHACKFRVTGTKNASSSAVTVTVDSMKITYNPSGYSAANDNVFRALYALPPERKRRRRRQRLAA